MLTAAPGCSPLNGAAVKNEPSTTFPAISQLFPALSSPPVSAAFDHRRRLLRPRHERAAGRVRDGAREAALLGRLRQNDLRHRLRLQEPLAGLRGHEKWTREEGKEDPGGGLDGRAEGGICFSLCRKFGAKRLGIGNSWLSEEG